MKGLTDMYSCWRGVSGQNGTLILYRTQWLWT